MSSIASPIETGQRNELPANHGRLIRRLYETVYSNGTLTETKDLVAEDYTGYCTGSNETYHGPTGLKAHVARLRGAMYGFHIDIDSINGTPNRFEVNWTAHGRLERPALGLTPTCVVGPVGHEPRGPDVTITGSTIGTIEDGKITEATMRWNTESVNPEA